MTRRTFGQIIGLLLTSIGLRAAPDENACPRCGRQAHYVCSNRECSCWAGVPAGDLPLRETYTDIMQCPYCGFEAHIDFWFDRQMAAIAKAEGTPA